MKPAAVSLRWIVFALCVSVIGACGRSEPPPPAAPAAASVPTPAQATPTTTIIAAPQPVKSKVATYDGTLPCADCAGIETHLVLQHDALGRNSYVLNETYKGKAPQPFLSAGRWTLSVGTPDDPQVALVHLNSGQPADSKTWRVDDNGSLTLVDKAGKPADSSLNYTLKHSGGDLDFYALYQAELAKATSSATNR